MAWRGLQINTYYNTGKQPLGCSRPLQTFGNRLYPASTLVFRHIRT